jgi:hypothetical protein
MVTSPTAAQRSVPARHSTRSRTAVALAACALALLLGLSPATSLACACGCGVFDVGTASMFPQHSGAMGYLEYDYMDQNENWSGTSRAPAVNNDDKRIRTGFWNVGLQYQFNRSWGASVEIPYWQRYFQTVDADTGDLVDFTHGAVGDIRLKGRYTGFSPDMSTGITFGVKLPTGETNYAGFDPDTSIGSGSTDLLLGAYHLGNLSANNQWRYFVQAQLQQIMSHKSNYRPGNEVVATAGVYYEGWQVSPKVKIAPVLQFNATYRGHDGGPDGHPQDTGYTRVLVSPGVQVDAARLSVFLDVGLPVHTNVSGNQLVSSQFWRMNLSYHF